MLFIFSDFVNLFVYTITFSPGCHITVLTTRTNDPREFCSAATQ